MVRRATFFLRSTDSISIIPLFSVMPSSLKICFFPDYTVSVTCMPTHILDGSADGGRHPTKIAYFYSCGTKKYKAPSFTQYAMSSLIGSDSAAADLEVSYISVLGLVKTTLSRSKCVLMFSYI